MTEDSRTQIIRWVNSLTSHPIHKIQHLGNGVAYSHILKYYYPDQLNLHKINNSAKLQFQILNNLKILQQTFIRLKFPKNLDVDLFQKTANKAKQNEISIKLGTYSVAQKILVEAESKEYGKLYKLGIETELIKFFKKISILEFGVVQEIQILKYTPVTGKSSVSSQLFQNNYLALIERIKQILTKDGDEIQKVHNLKLLLNIKQTKKKTKQIQLLENTENLMEGINQPQN